MRCSSVQESVRKSPEVPTFSLQQVAEFEVHYREGYDIQDPTYLAWKSTYHPVPEEASGSSSPSQLVLQHFPLLLLLVIQCLPLLVSLLLLELQNLLFLLVSILWIHPLV